KSAATICVAYDNMQRFFPESKIALTGNPIRQDILDLKDKKEAALKYYGIASGKKVLLITGGSLGARTLNESILQGMQALAGADVEVLWQAGKFYIEEYAPKVKSFAFANVKILPFLDRMDYAYAAADVVIAR